ncbi:MAG: serine/threonine protein kinase [Anaerolineae bacterium]|nr:serine/threonine protein kinase [Anaerolineae bacterium]
MGGPSSRDTGSPAHRGRRWIDKYELLERLGRGWQGEVFRGFDPDRKQRVAIKLLRQENVRAHTTMAQFQDGIEAIAALQHPNIARVFDFGLVDDVYFIVMELLEGPSVRDLLGERRGGLPQNEAVSILKQIAEALSYAHARGVIHGDVQPAHVIFAADDRLVLTDFSLAQALGDPTLTGTPAYLAPEQANGQPPTARSDLYALGVVLYEMVTGRLPFTGEDTQTILERHRTEPPAAPSEINASISPHIERVILHALEKDPAARFRSVREMIAALETGEKSDDYDTFALRSAALRDADAARAQELDAARRQFRAARQAKQEGERADTEKQPSGLLNSLLNRLRRRQDDDTTDS